MRMIKKRYIRYWLSLLLSQQGLTFAETNHQLSLAGDELMPTEKNVMQNKAAQANLQHVIATNKIEPIKANSLDHAAPCDPLNVPDQPKNLNNVTLFIQYAGVKCPASTLNTLPNKSLSKPNLAITPKVDAPLLKVKTISLHDVLQSVLFKSPEIAQTYASINENKSTVDLASSAYFPTLSANGEYSWQRQSSYNNGFGGVGDGKFGPPIKTVSGSLNLAWVLFDFGQRSANLAEAKNRLNSVIATQESSTITTLIEALRLYTEAVNAYGQWQTLIEAETVAGKSMEIVQALYDAKVAGLTEKLQAQTALAQATLDRSVAQGEWETAKGQLAVAMALPVSLNYELADETGTFKAAITQAQIDGILDEVKRYHPRVRSLKAEVAALESRLASIKAGNKGSLNLVMSGTKSNSYNFDGANNDLESKNMNIGLQAKIPLLNWQEQSAKEGQINAQIESAESRIVSVQNELATDIWRNIQQIKTTSNNLVTTQKLLDSAEQNYQVALGRYRSGVGEVSDLLRAQTTLANAKQQLQKVKVNHMQSHIRLSLAAGRLTTNNAALENQE